MFFVTLWPNALIKAPWNLSLTARVNLRGGGHTLESSLRALEPELLPFTLFRPEPVRQGPEHRLPSFDCCLHLKPPRLLWIVFFFFISTPFPIGYQQINYQNVSLKVPNCLALCFLFSLTCGKTNANHTTKDTRKTSSLLSTSLTLAPFLPMLP